MPGLSSQTIPATLLAILPGLLGCSRAWADDPPMGHPASATMGGRQFWTDLLVSPGARIQQNVLTGHHRLLDKDDRRLTWGSLKTCMGEYQKLRDAGKLPACQPKVVLVLHGLIRTRFAMQGLADYLQQQDDSISVLNVGYASTRGDLDDHAQALKSILEHLDGAEEISIVAHSMGNIVTRRYINQFPADPRLKRMVMLGPPNQGAALARMLKGNVVFRAIYGKSLEQLGDQDLEKRLAIPPFEFAVIAGGGGVDNPWIEGPDDFVVGVEEAKLAGAADHVVLEVMHTTMMDQAAVQQATLRFLREGRLRDEGEPVPVPRSER